MNTERIRALADLIEQQPHTDQSAPSGFNMEMWTHDCGTPCCIAGWALQQYNNGDTDEYSYSLAAARTLDMDVKTASALFLPASSECPVATPDITPSHAAAVLRHLADHGVVDWTVGVSV